MNLVQMSISGAVMILITVIIRTMLLHKLPKRMFLILWGVISVRLLIPYLLPCSLSVYSLLKHSGLTEAAADNAYASIVPNFSSDAIFDDGSGIDPWVVIQLIGTLLFAAFFTVTYLKCLRRFSESLPIDNNYTKKWLAEHKIFRRISVRCSDQISIPLTYGIFHPVILFPRKINQFKTEDMKYVLTHEYVHIRRFDAVFKIVLTVALCVHWFNPLVWLMYIIANMDIELSCDNDVIHMLGDNEKQAYAMLMIRIEELKSGITPLINYFGKSPIKKRIVAIMNFKKASALAIAAAVCLVVGMTTTFATTIETRNSDLSQQTDQFSESTAEIKNTADPSNIKTEPSISLAAESNDADKAQADAIPAETSDSTIGDEPFSNRSNITLEPGMEVPVPVDESCIMHYDTDENGNIIVQYFSIEDEPAPAVEANEYLHEEIIEDGIIIAP